MFIFGWLYLRVCPSVNAELPVGHKVFLFGQVLIHLRLLWPEIHVFDKHARPRVMCPVKWRVGMAFTFHFFLSVKIP